MGTFDISSGAKLRVTCHNDTVIINPNASADDGDDLLMAVKPTNGSLLEGSIVLSLPTAKKCRKIQVSLVGRQNIAVDGLYDTYETTHSKLEIDTGVQTLGPGEHHFAFSFIVDATAAPYERSAYGRTYQRITAAAAGLGKLGSELVAHQEVSFVANLSPTDGIPPGFHLEQQIMNDTLGPVGLCLTSKYLLVAGFLRLSLVLPSIAEPIQLEDIQVHLYQMFDLRSLRHPERTDSKRSVIPLWSARADSKASLAQLQPGQEYEVDQQFRLKDDDSVRASTSPNSKTGIRVTHRLAVVVHFTPLTNNPKKETRELKIATDATLSSCCCIIEQLQLPKYSCQPRLDDLDIDAALLGLCSSCLCKVAASSDLMARYAIPAEELKAAQNQLEYSRGPWKEDEEFIADLQRRQLDPPAESIPPPPPSYESA